MFPARILFKRRNVQIALEDLVAAVRNWPLWLYTTKLEFRLRYKRSVLGPFWVTLNMGIMTAALGIVYGTIFSVPVREYLPFISAGIVIWTLMANVITEASQAFVLNRDALKNVNVPLSIFALRVVASNTLAFLHNLVVFAVLLVIWPHLLSFQILWVIPALTLFILTMVFASILAATLCARYRDLVQIISSAVTIAFYVTPVIWERRLVQNRSWIADWNPLYHYLEIVRAPLLGREPAVASWLFALISTGVVVLLALLVFGYYRRRVVYVV